MSSCFCSFEVNFLTGPPGKDSKKEPQASFSLKSLFLGGKTKVSIGIIYFELTTKITKWASVLV